MAVAAGEPLWDLLLADLTSPGPGENTGDLSGAGDVNLTFQLNQPATCQFKLPVMNPIVPDLLTNPHAFIKAYKDRELAALFEITSIQVAGGSGGRDVAVVATEAPYVALQRRHVGLSAAGTYYDALDRGLIAEQIIDEVNALSDSLVRFGTATPSSAASAGPIRYRPAMELIQELGEPINGFDHWFTPTDPWTDVDDSIGYLQVAPLRGTTRTEAIFEFGGGRSNVADYSWQIDNSTRITRAYSLPPGYPENAGLVVKSQFDATTEASIRRREAIVSSELVDEDLRQELVDEHVDVRSTPRNIYTFNPDIDDLTGRVPTFLTDYDVGDILDCRVYDSGVMLLDGLVRVYGVQVEIDTSGTERITLTLVDEG